MCRWNRGSLIQWSAVMALLFSVAANAEIYKWTDEDGNVHFGDKPVDPAAAGKAQAVEIEEAYKPPQRSEQEMKALQNQQRARAKADERRRDAQEKKLAEEKAAKDQRKAEICAALDADIEKFGSAKMINGILHVTYLTGEDGKSITAAEQRKIVEDLRARREEMACP